MARLGGGCGGRRGGIFPAVGSARDGGDILSGDKAGGKDTGDILAGRDGGATSPTRSSPGQGRKIAATGNAGPGSRVGEPVPNHEWTAAGGWYRDQFSLMYRPAGHADDFFRAWLEVTGSAKIDSARQLFAALAAPRAPGKCVKCHSIDAAGSRAIAINWRGARPIKGHRRFTRFSHATHSKLLTEKGCLACHNPDPDSDYLAGFKTRDPHTSVSNFRPMKKESCARCHVANFAEQSCVLCHNYHVGTFPPALVAAPVSDRTTSNRPRARK